jgi:hypothetical protein
MTQKIVLGLIKKAIKSKYKKNVQMIIFESTNMKDVKASLTFEDGEILSNNEASESMGELVSAVVEQLNKKLECDTIDYVNVCIDYNKPANMTTICAYVKDGNKQQMTTKENF